MLFLGVRLQGERKDKTIIPIDLNVFANTNDSFVWRLAFNPTINGTFAYHDLAHSSLQGASGSSSNTVSDFGQVIAQGYVSNKNQASNINVRDARRLGVSITGVPYELVVIVTPLGNNMQMYASIQWREL